MQENVEFCPKSTFRKSRKVNFAKSSMYLCDLRSKMCNSSFHSGLNPSSATLFTTWFRTIRLQLCLQPGFEPPLPPRCKKRRLWFEANRLKPCCNLGLNGVSTLGSNRVAPSFQTLLQTKKTPRFYSRCLQTWVGTVVHTRWNGPCIVTKIFIPTRWFRAACASRRTTGCLHLRLRTCARDRRAIPGRFRRSLRS